MKVKDLMTTEVRTCDLNESLAGAASLMWDNDCGILPVLKDGNELIGLITDRDICMGLAMRDRNPSSVSVEEVMSGHVYAVSTEDDVHRALETMKEHRIRRVPVLDSDGQLKGVVSMNDVVLKAKEANGKKTPPITYADVVQTFQAICRHPELKTQAASGSK